MFSGKTTTMSNVDIKAIVAVLFTLFSLSYLGTFYIEDVDIQRDMLSMKDEFTRLGSISAYRSRSHHAVIAAAAVSEHLPNRKADVSDISSAVSVGASQLQPPFTKYAYTTLLHGIDDSYRYRGFLYNTIIFKKLLMEYGSTADVIAMIGYTYGERDSKFDDDIHLLESFGIKIYYLPRMLEQKQGKVTFGEMALLKITPWSFVQYEAVQYIDADVMPKKSMDMYFTLNRNSFHSGSASPVNSGWYLARPNREQYEALWTLAVARLQVPWDTTIGWGVPIPDTLPYRGGFKIVSDWNFNGASLDQGLFTYYFVLTNGQVQLFDHRDVRVYDKGYRLVKQEALSTALSPCCASRAPMDLFAHFTGRNKPWLKPPVDRKGPDVQRWFATLDSLKLSINSSSTLLQDAKSPLGYFHANK